MTTTGPRHPLLFFADRLPPLVGGMEMHARFFLEHFARHPRFPVQDTITLDRHGQTARLLGGQTVPIDIATLGSAAHYSVVFFNSGRWIEDSRAMRGAFPNAIFVYRTGGNEIVKAQLGREHRPLLEERQAYWAAALNDTIDLLITNSALTEQRLRSIGVDVPFLRCVGGVQVGSFGDTKRRVPGPPVLFSAARFVPYKNHALLIDVAAELARRGVDFRLRLAGVGPLLEEVRARAVAHQLGERVEFIGELDNETVCRETAAADMYIQLSGDVVTQVPGGSYVHCEGMGRSILEAISAGTFVIAGRSGALPEIVTPDRGALVELSDATSIANAIEPIVRSPPPPALGTDVYDWSVVFADYERAWEEHLARPRSH